MMIAVQQNSIHRESAVISTHLESSTLSLRSVVPIPTITMTPEMQLKNGQISQCSAGFLCSG